MPGFNFVIELCSFVRRDSLLIGFMLYCDNEFRPAHLAGLGQCNAALGDTRLGGLTPGGGWAAYGIGRAGALRRPTFA